MMPREILFYSDFPFGYHNPEAEEKMARFAARGWRVHYVEPLGIRNPRPAHLRRVLRRIVPSASRAGTQQPFDVVSPKLLPPRHVPLIDAINARWLKRQLVRPLSDPSMAVAWLRHPTPELLRALDEVPFALVVYEAVDDHPRSPGLSSRQRRLLSRAEREILARAGVVFAWSEPIRERLARSHDNVVLAPTALDLEQLVSAGASAPQPRHAVYVGALGFRFDAGLAAAVARALPQWTFTFAGPVDEGPARELSALSNVRLPGRIEPAAVPGLIASGAVCLLPYRLTPYNDLLFPIKLGEYLAVGRPVVATPIRAARELSPTVALASDPEGFAAEIEAEVASDSDEGRMARREVAASFSWEARIDQMEAAITAAIER